MLLLETLGVKMSFLQPVPSHLQLPVAVTCYWIRCSEPKVKLNQLKALLLMIVSEELQRITDDPGMSVFFGEYSFRCSATTEIQTIIHFSTLTGSCPNLEELALIYTIS